VQVRNLGLLNKKQSGGSSDVNLVTGYKAKARELKAKDFQTSPMPETDMSDSPTCFYRAACNADVV